MLGCAKYIVVANEIDLRNERIFSFHPTITHKEMFQSVKRLRFDTLISAGFIDEFMQCFGESMTLNIKARPDEDTRLLKKMFQIDDKHISIK